jgi:hypothetical protein
MTIYVKFKIKVFEVISTLDNLPSRGHRICNVLETESNISFVIEVSTIHTLYVQEWLKLA